LANELSLRPNAHSERAFLVVRHGGRWSDVLRLSPDQPSVIGRASSNAVTIRSHRASRRHAEIRWESGDWWVRDLGSRNGTRVSGERIGDAGRADSSAADGADDSATPPIARRLRDGDQIEIAGFTLVFVTRIDNVLSALPETGVAPFPGRSAGARPSRDASDDQMTIDGILSSEVTERLNESRYLDFSHHDLAAVPPADDSEAWPALFRLAYRVAACDSIASAAEITLETLGQSIPGCFGGVFLGRKRSGDDAATDCPPELVAFQTAGNRSYRPPSPRMIRFLGDSCRAMLIRNLVDDDELQSADSRGELSTQTAILAPIVLVKKSLNATSSTATSSTATSAARQSAGGVGFVHLYTVEPSARWRSTHLELAAAAAGVLGAAIDNLTERGRLASSLRRSRHAVASLRQRLEESIRIIGTSPPIQRLKEIIRRVGPTDTTVLVRGESGVGKELVAGAIHHESPRRDGPLVCLNCAALSPTLLESELFGHEKGAFTGATELKKGKFEAADGGTLMLDEIGEMDVNLQAKLLRVLEGHPFERLGGQVPLRVDVRLIAATNRDLAAEVAAGRFRGDLYYRLNVVEIVVPPLRERGDDLLKLADHFVRHFADKTARVVDGLTVAARQAIAGHDWPGNVRELKNVIERAVVLGNDPLIDVADLGLPAKPVMTAHASDADPKMDASSDDKEAGGCVLVSPAVGTMAVPTSERAAIDPTLSLEEVERRHLVEVLRANDGNKSRAAIVLGIERSTLDRKLKRYGLNRGSGW